MASSTSNLDLISQSQSSKETTANALFDACSPASLFGRRQSTTSGLTWGYYGGPFKNTSGTISILSNGTKTLTASSTNYLEADASDGTVYVNTSAFTAGRIKLYSIVTGTSSVTSYIDYRATSVAGFTASAISIVDAGGIITATDVEGALQENRTAIDAIEDNAITSSGSITCAGTIGADDQTVDIATDGVNGTHIDWGTGASQVSADNVPDGSTNAIITITQESNFEAAYTHVSSDGTDHTYIDQDVSATAIPEFAGTIAKSTATPASLGSELTTNGTFTGAATGWTLGTNWAYGTDNVVLTLDGAAEGALSQSISVTSGNSYLIEWSQTNSVANNGTLTPSIGTVNGISVSPTDTSVDTMSQVLVASATGSVTFALTPTDATSSGTITVDDVTVKEITTVSAANVLKDASGNIRYEERATDLTGNTWNGEGAGRHNITGDNNTANGFQSLYSNTNGDNNTANGRQSLYSNTNGYNNTANGYMSLYSNANGSRNTANGLQSLYSNTTGGDNVANGFQSFYSNTTGNYNTANGFRSLYSNTTGNYNTANGYQAGRYISGGVNPNETSSNSVYLGFNTKALADGDSNEIVIGYTATGAGSNTATLGNTSIAKTILRGDILINAAAVPTANSGNVIVVPDNTADPTMGTNTAGFYGKDVSGTVEAFAIDEAGTAAQLTSHPADAPTYLYDDGDLMPPRIQRDMNYYLGVITWVNITRQAKLNEKLYNGEPMPADPLDRKVIVEETFAKYNARTGNNLQIADWDANQAQAEAERNERAAQILASVEYADSELAVIGTDLSKETDDEKIKELNTKKAEIQAAKDALVIPAPFEKRELPAQIQRYMK